MSAEPTQLRIGRIARCHGVRGAVLVDSYTDLPEERWRTGQSVIVAGQDLTIANARPMQERILLTFEEISDREAAQDLQHRDIFVLEVLDDTVVEDDDESWHIQQLQGLDVVLESDEHVGTVKRVLIYPAQELLEIAVEGNQTQLLPFVYDFILEVDIDGGKIIVDPPAGLFDSFEATETADASDVTGVNDAD